MAHLNELRDLIKRLDDLLADPHPGLTTWSETYDAIMNCIADFMSNKIVRRLMDERHLVPLYQDGSTEMMTYDAFCSTLDKKYGALLSAGLICDIKLKANKLCELAFNEAAGVGINPSDADYYNQVCRRLELILGSDAAGASRGISLLLGHLIEAATLRGRQFLEVAGPR